MKKELLFEKLYKETQEYGRVQFVKLLQHQQLVINRLSRKIQRLKKENTTKINVEDHKYIGEKKDKCYAIVCGDYKPKNIFEKIYYELWRMRGVSPSGLYRYKIVKRATFIHELKKEQNAKSKIVNKKVKNRV